LHSAYCLDFLNKYFFPLRIDATPETNKRLGRLVNHCRRNGNLTPRLHLQDGQPRIIFIASKAIKPGEQLCYDYGDFDIESLREHNWLSASELKKKLKQQIDTNSRNYEYYVIMNIFKV